MSENVLEMNEGGLGKIEIAPEVIEVIAGIAASEIEGVAMMRGNFTTGVAELLGKKTHGRGVRVDLTDHAIKIDVYCVLHYGVSIPKIAQKMQDNIYQALLNMTGLETDEINVHVVNMYIESSKKEVEKEDE